MAAEIPEEIKITPEMIEAGVTAISMWADYDEMVAEVYVAMERARRANRARQLADR